MGGCRGSQLIHQVVTPCWHVAMCNSMCGYVVPYVAIILHNTAHVIALLIHRWHTYAISGCGMMIATCEIAV